MNREKILFFIKNKLSEYRFNHTLTVERNISILADLYNLNLEDCKITALFHDIAKELNDNKTKIIINNDEIITQYPKNSWHGFASAQILIENFPNLITKDILEAIKYHTVGKKAWNQLGYALYISDFCDPKKPNKDEINLVWNKAKENLIQACILRTNFTIKKLFKKKIKPFKTTLEMLEELENKI